MDLGTPRTMLCVFHLLAHAPATIPRPAALGNVSLHHRTAESPSQNPVTTAPGQATRGCDILDIASQTHELLVRAPAPPLPAMCIETETR
jgi:hypothetical protein